MKIEYESKRFSADHMAVIEQANRIIDDYRGQGYDLTLRQLYYQFVARDVFANSDRNYKRLGSILSDARRAGLVDWSAIVDRTRNLRTHSSWDSPTDILESCIGCYDVDRWAEQPAYVEFWIEKDALIGVLETACDKWRVPYFSCRGYVSDSEAWAAGRRIAEQLDDGKEAVVFHLGDHDPSGIDMTRDIESRLGLFAEAPVRVERIALNMGQIRRYRPPPNPAKTTDARFKAYLELHGAESWELDALDPTTIGRLVDESIEGVLDRDAWERSIAKRDQGRNALRTARRFVAAGDA